MHFEPYPFEKLNSLLQDIKPNLNFEASTLTIGEPQFSTPEFIQKTLKESTHYLNKYPKSSGEDFLKEAIINFNQKRFGISLTKEEIIPVFGTKEALFNFPQFALFDKIEPTIAFTNPFYQIYEGAAIASKSKIIYLDLKEENNFLPIICDKDLKNCDLVILNYPNNPTGAMMPKDELIKWVHKAIEFDFILLNDECYSEIYCDENNKPISLLEACKACNNIEYKNCLSLNSISKRSSSPGLRSGFIAGDKKILQEYAHYRTYLGCAIPLSLQVAAAVAWQDNEHVKQFREIYKKNLQIAQDILNITIPKASFYIWLPVEDELHFTRELFKHKNIKVLPGSYLGKNNLGKGYVRIALVEDNAKTKEIILRIKDFMDAK